MKTNIYFFILIVLGSVSSFPIFAITPQQEAMIKSALPLEQQQEYYEKFNLNGGLGSEISSNEMKGIIPSMKKKSDKQIEEDKEECEEIKCIFGYSIFNEFPVSFNSTDRAPVSSSYILGPGDVIKVTYYGSNSKTRKSEIENNGSFDLPILGPVNISGLTLDKAIDLISQKVESELIGTKVSVSLSDFRKVTVFLLGEANYPGSYTLNAFSTVTTALFNGGGVSKMGSLRNIKINRGGKLVSTYDFYDFLLRGDSSSDIKLQDGDVVFIPFIKNKVHLEGPFKRPSTYEFLNGETVEEAIDFAGGFLSPLEKAQRLGLSYINKDSSIRINKEFSLNDMPMGRMLENGDFITINGLGGFEEGSIELKGEVRYPGVYSFVKGERMLSVINRAGGFTDFSFSEGAVFTRKEVAKRQKEGFERMASSLEQTVVDMVTTGENISEFSLEPINSLIKKLRTMDPIGRQVIDANLLELKQDPFKNFTLRNGDVLLVPQRPEYINIVGEVLNPNTLRFNPNLGVSNYLARSGGLTETADESKIFIINPNGTSYVFKRTLFKNNQNILPGSTIVVPRDSKPFDAIKITQIITPILADLATSAAAIAAISD